MHYSLLYQLATAAMLFFITSSCCSAGTLVKICDIDDYSTMYIVKESVGIIENTTSISKYKPIAYEVVFKNETRGLEAHSYIASVMTEDKILYLKEVKEPILTSQGVKKNITAKINQWTKTSIDSPGGSAFIKALEILNKAKSPKNR